MDIAGLAKGASVARGSAINSYHISGRQMLWCMVRCFDNADIYGDESDSLRDVEILNLERCLQILR